LRARKTALNPFAYQQISRENMGYLELVKVCTRPHYKIVDGKKKIETNSFVYSRERKSKKCLCGGRLIEKWIAVN